VATQFIKIMGGLHGLSCLSNSEKFRACVPACQRHRVWYRNGRCCDWNRHWKIICSRVLPLKKSQPSSEPADKKDATGEGKFRQSVTRMVRDGTLVHCYLACGHMLTIHSSEVASPSSMECWACEAERKKS
jgi:hypothetical protein